MKTFSRIPWLAYRIWRHPGLGKEEIFAFQNKQLRRIICFAYSQVAYYREIFDKAGIRPKDIRSIKDLKYLPVTSKKSLRDQPLENINARGMNSHKLIVRKTTGSTGEPLTIRRTSSEEFMACLFRLRVMDYYGLNRRDNVVRIGTRTRNDMPLAWRLGQYLGQYRQELIHLLDSPDIIANKLLELKPDVMTGNAGVITRVSEEFRSLGKKVLPLRFIVTGAEVLTPMMRSKISRTLGIPVYDTYASEELDLIAWECKETGHYHVCDDNLILEIIKNGSPAPAGERGDVVATSLHFSAMPFIRYRLGDEVTAGEQTCRCRQPFSTISRIEGRKTDYLILPGGKELFASSIAYILHEKAAWIYQYELVQAREDQVILRVVTDALPAPDKLGSLVREIKDLLGPGVIFLIEKVIEIKPGAGGKYRILRSHVRSSYQNEDLPPA